MSVGYNMGLPSLAPFMYVEKHEKRKPLGVIAFGAYNAFGLIGPEKGGVALVVEEPTPGVLATKSVPYKPKERAALAEKLLAAESVAELIQLAVAEGGFDWRCDPEDALHALERH